MNNKVILPNPLRQKLKLALFLLIIFTVVFAGTLLLLRAVSVKDYNGNVTEITGELQEIIYVEEDNVRIVVDGNTYTVNPVNRFTENLNWEELTHQTVTLYVSQTQVGKIRLVLGVKQGDNVLADYEQIVKLAQEENREVMITFGVMTGVVFVATCGVYVWRLKLSPNKEYNLAQKYSEFSLSRHPSCPEYKKFTVFMLVFVALIVLITTTIGIVCECVDELAVQIAVGASLGGVVLFGTATLLLIIPLWLFKKEREFYAKNYPFDFSDVSQIPMRKKFKEHLQAELKKEREKYPHRYSDGGNYLTVEFSDGGLKLYDIERLYIGDDTYTAEDVFDLEDDERDEKCLVCTIDYQTLNFEALPFYRKTHHPLTVIVKSRLSITDLPTVLHDYEISNDIHLILDSNLLATLRQFDVPVENLDYILDNKETLIAQNCAGKKK